jgi:hypothetical protein
MNNLIQCSANFGFSEHLVGRPESRHACG